jgi:NAD(P)-dependent dehydrogenase (short-subunit alcohol dehydrogenase family)
MTTIQPSERQVAEVADTGRLANKVAVITGAASGLGEAAARRFAEEGARLALIDYDESGVAKLAAELGGAALSYPADVSSHDIMCDVAQSVLDDFGQVDVVFANAGIEGVGRAAELTEEQFDRVIGVNLKGAWLSAKFFLPHMVARCSGSIINTASVGGLVGVANIAPYAMAKGGVIAMTRQMAVDYSPSGIRVNAICPGTVPTPLVVRNWEQKGEDVDERIAALAERHLIRRAGMPTDIANAAIYLASDESSWVTGTTLTVDGGHTAV